MRVIPLKMLKCVMRCQIRNLICINLLLGCFPAHAHWSRTPLEVQHAPQSTFVLAPEFFTTSSFKNFTNASDRLIVKNLTKHSALGLDAKAIYGVSEKISLFGVLRWQKVTATHPQGGETFGLGDQTLGLNFLITDEGEPSRFYFQAEATLAPYDNQAQLKDGTPILGDDSNDFSLGGFWENDVSKLSQGMLTLTAGAAYRFRNSDYAAAGQWSIFGTYLPQTSGVLAGIGLYGFHSLREKDPNAPQDTNPCFAIAGTGGSCYAGSQAPHLIQFKATMGYQISETFLTKISYSTSAWGIAAPDFWAFSGGVEFRLGEGGSRPARSSGGNKVKSQSSSRKKEFLTYQSNIEAKVTRVNDKLGLVKIDQGSASDVTVGQTFDLFSVKSDGSLGELVARAKVTSVKSDESALKITEYFKEVWIEEGFAARALIE